MNAYRIIFAGTPVFSAIALKALLHSHHEVIAVYTQPDRPAGRGQKLTASPVKELALEHHIPVYQPVTLRDADEQKKLADLNADVMIVAAYGLLLPREVLEAPRLGCINIHASLLPRWRGAAPIQRAILAEDTATGITIMQMDEGLDTGAMLYRTECAIEANETSESLHDKLAAMGADALTHTLNHLSNLSAIPQDNSAATYARKIKKEEAHINWSESAEKLDALVRAFNPWPVAYFSLGENRVRVWQARAISEKTNAKPGTIIHRDASSIDVATGKNILRLLTLQFPGGKILPVAEILKSRDSDFAIGNIL